jgi:hypothetical protein
MEYRACGQYAVLRYAGETSGPCPVQIAICLQDRAEGVGRVFGPGAARQPANIIHAEIPTAEHRYAVNRLAQYLV